MKDEHGFYDILKEEKKAGVYITGIIHIAVIIVLLIIQIDKDLHHESIFTIDFSQEEKEESQREKEKLIEEREKLKEAVAEKLNKMLADNKKHSIRNVAVDLSALIEENTDKEAKQLYEDARELEKRLKTGHKVDDSQDDSHTVLMSDKEDEDAPVYNGPSVVAYELNKRKARYLHVPAYKCLKKGMVTVLIVVNTAGRVIKAKIQDESSTDDKCIRECALDAAKRSLFTRDDGGQKKQEGYIIYKFIEQ